MRKISIVAVAILVAGYASADIATGFNSLPPVFEAGSPGVVLTGGFTAQLIWSDVAPSGVLDLSGKANANEVILVTETGFSPATFDAAVSQNGGFAFQFDDVDVGGLDINSGYLYSRIIEGPAITAGAWYLQSSLAQLGAGLPVYTNPDTTVNPPIYSTSILAAPVTIDADGLQVIPEPATFGLMGIAGLGMFLARKKTRS